MKKRKHQRMQTYSLLDEMMASPTDPLPIDQRTYHLTRIFSSLDNIASGDNPSRDDWRHCADAVNILESLVNIGVVSDVSGLLGDAVKALGAAGKRNLDGMQIRLDGPGLLAVRAVLEDYTEVLDSVPARDMIRAYRQTEQRIWGILNGKKKSNDVEVMAL